MNRKQEQRSGPSGPDLDFSPKSVYLAATTTGIDMIATGDCWAGFSLKGQDSRRRMAVLADRFAVRECGGGILVALTDGHGPDGEKAAQYVIDVLPDMLEVSGFFTGNKRGAATRACRLLDEAIERLWDGGTTLTAIFLRGNYLTIVEVGDSPAWIIDTAGQQGQLTTGNHTLYNNDECNRVLAAGGRIRKNAIIDPSATSEGEWRRKIRLTRSLGDRIFAGLVIPDPRVKTYELSRDWTRVRIGSDGFEDEVSYLPPAVAQEWARRDVELATSSMHRFMLGRPPSDDCTMIEVDLSFARTLAASR